MLPSEGRLVLDADYTVGRGGAAASGLLSLPPPAWSSCPGCQGCWGPEFSVHAAHGRASIPQAGARQRKGAPNSHLHLPRT